MFAMEGQAREVLELSNLGWERGELVALKMQPRQVRELSNLRRECGEWVFSEPSAGPVGLRVSSNLKNKEMLFSTARPSPVPSS